MRILQNKVATTIKDNGYPPGDKTKIHLLIETKWFRIAHTINEMFDTWYIGWYRHLSVERVKRTYKGEVKKFWNRQWCIEYPWFPAEWFKIEDTNERPIR